MMHQDLPAACGGCLTRREFVERSALAGVVAFLAACSGGGGSSGGGPTSSGPLTLSLADYPALAASGGIVRVTVGGRPIAVVRESDTSFAAFSMVCPHQGTTINLNGAGFLCPNHGARFNAQGVWTGGERTSNLSTVAVVYDATAGTVTVG
jgi:Rieske Fe-S protein